MPFDVSWALEDRIIQLHFSGVISHTKIDAAHRQFVELVNAGTAPVHVYVNLNAVTAYPHDLRWVLNVIQRPAGANGWNLFIVSEPRFHFFIHTMLQLVRGSYRSFATLDEAQRFLWEQDPTCR